MCDYEQCEGYRVFNLAQLDPERESPAQNEFGKTVDFEEWAETFRGFSEYCPMEKGESCPVVDLIIRQDPEMRTKFEEIKNYRGI